MLIWLVASFIDFWKQPVVYFISFFLLFSGFQFHWVLLFFLLISCFYLIWNYFAILFKGFLIGSWSISLRYFFSFPLYRVSAINICLNTCLSVSHIYWNIIFSVSFNLMFFLNFIWDFIFGWWIIRGVLFSFQIFGDFFPYYLSVTISYHHREHTCIWQFFQSEVHDVACPGICPWALAKHV